MRCHCRCGNVSPLGITVLQTPSSDLRERGQRSDPFCCPQNAQGPAQPPLPPIKPSRAAPGGLSTHRNGLCQVVPPAPTTPKPGWYQAAGNSNPGTQNPATVWHSHIPGQDPIPSVELLAAQGPCGPSVLQPQRICRKSGSNLSLAQTWREVTAVNELNDWINVPPSSRQLCWTQLFSDN